MLIVTKDYYIELLKKYSPKIGKGASVPLAVDRDRHPVTLKTHKWLLEITPD